MSASPRRRLRDRVRRTSVRARTTAAAILVVAVVLALGAVAVVLSLSAALTEGVSSAAENRAEEIATRIEADELPDVEPGSDAGDAQDAADAEDAAEEFIGEAEDEVVVVLDPAGTVLLSAGDAEEARALADQAGLFGSDPGDRITLAGERYALAHSDAESERESDEDEAEDAGDAGEQETRVLVARSLDDVAESVGTLSLLLAGGVPVALLLIGATTWVVVGRALRPVEQIRARAAAIDGARLDRRVPEPPSGDEIARLARTMNLMLDRLEASARRQRQLVADTSHELRSPLASIRQSAEIATAHPAAMPAEELSANVLAESVRMQGIVDDLLLLARADERDLRLRSAEVDLDDLLYAETRRLRSHAVEVGSEIEPVRAIGDASALTRVLRNLVDNAERHARQRIRLELTGTDAEAVIAVEDDGPGVPVAERERIFERFVRLDDARARDDGGSGLGLAIVQEIASAHGGRVRVREASLGGARFELRLPRQEP